MAQNGTPVVPDSLINKTNNNLKQETKSDGKEALPGCETKGPAEDVQADRPNKDDKKNLGPKKKIPGSVSFKKYMPSEDSYVLSLIEVITQTAINALKHSPRTKAELRKLILQVSEGGYIC